MFDFTGQKILVVGGSSGIGLATAVLARDCGAEVTIAARTKEKLEAIAKKIGVAATVLDVTQNSEVEAYLSATEWDHVVVTGSDVKMAAVKTLDLSDAMNAMDSKFWGFYRVARAARIKPGGSLSVVAGFLATRPAAGRALMGAINAALENIVKGLALELKPVRVNALSPAVVDTEMWHVMAPDARAAMLSTLAEKYPAGRVGNPKDIAQMILALAAIPYATGTVVTLDGGASLV